MGTLTKKEISPLLPEYAFTKEGWLNDGVF